MSNGQKSLKYSTVDNKQKQGNGHYSHHFFKSPICVCHQQGITFPYCTGKLHCDRFQCNTMLEEMQLSLVIVNIIKFTCCLVSCLKPLTVNN